MAAVQAFARANQLDRIVLDSRPARLGIIATGKAYLDLCQALADLGITDKDAQGLGLRIYKVAMTWPLEESGARRFAEGLQDVLVVEEKRGFIEDQLMRILYNIDAFSRPTIAGKRDETGAPLLPSEGELTPTMVPPRWWQDCAGSAIKARCWSSGWRGWRLSNVPSPRPRPSSCRARRSSALVARTTPQHACRKAAAPWPASPATAWP